MYRVESKNKEYAHHFSMVLQGVLKTGFMDVNSGKVDCNTVMLL